ncbi:MAG: hypothetical protein JNK64_23640 [Myxococcales bacterium]|nr:hypothetical protein [Myxococcales bacterium]
MRWLALIVLIAAAPAAAQPAAPPGWDDVPAMLDAALAPHADTLRGCLAGPPPRTIGLVAFRDRHDRTAVAMPVLGVGYRGLTPEERCLGRAVAAIVVPPLPPTLAQVGFAYTITAAGAPAPALDPAFVDWRAPIATLTAGLDPHVAAIAACDRRARTVRLNVDRRRDRTRVWLPAWQFHAPGGDGSTPARERTVKACIARAIRGVALPLLPRTMGELQLELRTAPSTK